MKKIAKPYTINILGQKWTVRESNAVIDPNTGSLACGLCDHPALTIWISSELDNQMKVITLLHELFHAYTRRSGIYNAQLSHDLEEIIADQFSTVLAEVFDFKV